RRAGLRYHLVGGQSFFDRREVRDFLAYLKVFLNPNDDMSLLRIANVPARGLSDRTMEGLLSASQERQCSVFTAMKNTAVQATFPAKTRESIETFVDFIERTRAQLTEGALGRTVQTTMETPPGGSRRRVEADSNSAPAAPPPYAGGCEADKDHVLRGWAQRFLAETGYLDELRRSEK